LAPNPLGLRRQPVLSPDHFAILEAYARPGLLKPTIEPRLAGELVGPGYMEQKLGGYVITLRGREALRRRPKATILDAT
jgi:hypothetical protein